MLSFGNLPIRRKLVLAFALTTAVALMLASSFFAVSTWRGEQKKAVEELQAIANLIGANSTAALVFQDKIAATEILSALSTIHDVTLAVLYDEKGDVFAQYIHPDIKSAGAEVRDNTIPFSASEDGELKAVSQVHLDGRPIGTVVIHGTLQSRIQHLKDQMITALITTIFCFAVAILIAWRLQQGITSPVTSLTNMLMRISREQDYSVRTDISREDEIGTLAKGINDMLARVQERDSQLLQHHHELEEEVMRRTAALKEANDKLTVELKERERFQEELKGAHQALEKHHRQISLLGEMNEHMQSCHTIMETVPVMAYYNQQLFSSASGALYVFNKSRSLVESLACWGATTSEEDVFRQEDCWALRQGTVHIVSDPGNGLICAHYTNITDGPYICVPIIAYGEVIGVLHIQFQPGLIIDDDLRKLAVNTVEQVGLALANLKLREALTEQSFRDPLTGLYNRRFMQESLERELARAKRTQKYIGIIMLDIDHFKKFNDTYGHEAGDVVLRSVSSYLQESIRDSDIACRFGGEEFIVILPDMEKDLLVERAEKIRNEIKSLQIKYGAKQFNDVTVSLGVALTIDSSIDEFLKSADEALYEAKNRGRDCVVSASSGNSLKKSKETGIRRKSAVD